MAAAVSSGAQSVLFGDSVCLSRLRRDEVILSLGKFYPIHLTKLKQTSNNLIQLQVVLHLLNQAHLVNQQQDSNFCHGFLSDCQPIGGQQPVLSGSYIQLQERPEPDVRCTCSQEKYRNQGKP